MDVDDAIRRSVRSAHAWLASWLRDAAYPLWSTRGRDSVRGGFHEKLSLGAEPLELPRRARVQPRQACAFAQAPALGWNGDAASAVAHGLDYFLDRYRRPDGLFRTLVDPDGAPLDEQALLYDQAFALLGFAEACKVPGQHLDLSAEARRLRTLLYEQLKRAGPGFDSGLPTREPLLANPHMHLFEASLAWMSIDDDPAWRGLADEIGALALRHFIDPASGAVRESFDASWSPLAEVAGRIVEPGHQFEWAWLLLRWGVDRPPVRQAAMRLIDLGERHGVHRGVAVNALLDDFSVHDGTARLWPQTERIKAAAIAMRLTGEARYWSMADEAARGLLRFLDTEVPGLWRDRLLLDDEFVSEPAPASSFYHIVLAVAELGDSLDSPASPR